MLKKLINRIGLPTPKIGKTIRNVGLAIVGAGTTSLMLPEIPAEYIDMGLIAFAIVLVFFGESQTATTIIEDVLKDQEKQDS